MCLRETGAIVEEILSGIPDVELAQLASRLDARLLVVGSLGRRSDEWLLGSVAEHAAVRAPISTLVVRSALPFEAWARGERALKIFAAFDFTGTAEAALRWIKCLAAAGPCEVVVGYVDWPLGEAARLGISGAVAAGASQPAAGAADPRARAIGKGGCLAGRGCRPSSAWNRASAAPTCDWSRWRARRRRTSSSPARTSGTAWAASPHPSIARGVLFATRR